MPQEQQRTIESGRQGIASLVIQSAQNLPIFHLLAPERTAELTEIVNVVRRLCPTSLPCSQLTGLQVSILSEQNAILEAPPSQRRFFISFNELRGYMGKLQAFTNHVKVLQSAAEVAYAQKQQQQQGPHHMPQPPGPPPPPAMTQTMSNQGQMAPELQQGMMNQNGQFIQRPPTADALRQQQLQQQQQQQQQLAQDALHRQQMQQNQMHIQQSILAAKNAKKSLGAPGAVNSPSPATSATPVNQAPTPGPSDAPTPAAVTKSPAVEPKPAPKKTLPKPKAPPAGAQKRRPSKSTPKLAPTEVPTPVPAPAPSLGPVGPSADRKRSREDDTLADGPVDSPKKQKTEEETEAEIVAKENELAIKRAADVQAASVSMDSAFAFLDKSCEEFKVVMESEGKTEHDDSTLQSLLRMLNGGGVDPLAPFGGPLPEAQPAVPLEVAAPPSPKDEPEDWEWLLDTKVFDDATVGETPDLVASTSSQGPTPNSDGGVDHPAVPAAPKKEESDIGITEGPEWWANIGAPDGRYYVDESEWKWDGELKSNGTWPIIYPEVSTSGTS